MVNIYRISAITFKEGIRNRALQGIMCIAVMLCLVYVGVIQMFAFETGKVMVDLGSASVSVAGLVIVVFLAITMLTRDLHQRSICLILSRPVSRSEYVLGKFSGLAMMVLAAVVLIASVAVISGLIGLKFTIEMAAPRNFSLIQLGATVFFKYMALIILLSIAFLFAVTTSNEYLSMLLTMMTYLIGNSLETIVKVAGLGTDVRLSSSYVGMLKVLTWVFPNFSAFDLKVYIGYGMSMPVFHILWTTLYGLLYIVLIISLTIVVFNRREIR